jgi:hypothetical protein
LFALVVVKELAVEGSTIDTIMCFFNINEEEYVLYYLDLLSARTAPINITTLWRVEFFFLKPV